jgi:hypothetical protein
VVVVIVVIVVIVVPRICPAGARCTLSSFQPINDKSTNWGAVLLVAQVKEVEDCCQWKEGLEEEEAEDRKYKKKRVMTEAQAG